jgi:Chagasin family peptidase inhibitor I42
MNEVPSRVTLRVGDQLEFELLGLGTAGYRWRSEISSPCVVDVVWQRDAPAGRVTICALAPGTTTLHLAQSRPWEGAAPPLSSHTIGIEVMP